MRDILVVGLVVWGSLAALKRPWIGILLWTWLSIMNPHRYTFGFAYSFPVAALAAACTLIGLVATRDKQSPMVGPPVTWFVVFCCWMTLTWLLGVDVEGDYEQWKKVMKINLMLLVGLALIRSKVQIMTLMCVVVASLAILGIKGGIFTLLHAGSYRVWGPPGSFIEDNNEFALSLVMTIPLMRFLQLQAQSALLKRTLVLGMGLVAISALGSHSRGALLALISMALFLWLGSKNKGSMGVLLVVAGALMIGFMPDEWSQRMDTMKTYEQDGSALGRINAWWHAWNIAMNRPLGVGFNPIRMDLALAYAPDPSDLRAAHSIYFQVLGNHGFIGLFIFLGIWISTWRSGTWIMKQTRNISEQKWAFDLAVMCQVSLVAYAVGGAFLSLAYFDLPYEVMALVVLTRLWVQRQTWLTEPAAYPRWLGAFNPPLPRQALKGALK